VRRPLTWFFLIAITVAVCLVAFYPASWLAAALETRTDGRFILADARGTIWRGSGLLGGAPSRNDPITQLLPGRFAWKLSPMVLLGKVDLVIENPEALTRPLHVTGGWSEWETGSEAITLPAERLAGLGAPLNTIAPAGQMILSWDQLRLTRQNGRIDVYGPVTLDMLDIASQLSSVRPLGSYRMTFDWAGQQAQLKLDTVKGPLLMSGTGRMGNGQFQFSGTAEAEAGQEESLGNLMNLLGQRRRVGDKNVIGLEFRQ
jgi:general secretion pathway protein N